MYSHNLYHIVSRKTNEFDGRGTVCSKKVIKIQTHMNFIGAKSLIKTEEIIDLSKADCEYMSITKKFTNGLH